MSADDQPLLDFAVPDELLSEAIAHGGAGTAAAVADLRLMPGTGDGKPPPMLPILREHGVAGVSLFTIAALVTLTIDNGFALLGPDIQKSFHINDAALGAVVFAASAAQFIFALPIALASDRGSRIKMAAFTLLLFAVVVPLMGLANSVWVFAGLAVISAIGHGPRDTTHMSYLTDAYPTEARARIFAYHSGADPIARTIGIFIVGTIASATGSWRWSTVIALLGIPVALAILRLREPAKGLNESSHILKRSGLDDDGADAGAPKVLFGSALQRLLRIRSLYWQLVAVAVLGFAGTGIPLFGSLYLKRTWHLDAGQRGHVYLVVGLAAFLGIPVAGFVGDRMFRRRPESCLVLAGACLAAFGTIYAASLYAPNLWVVTAGWFLAECMLAPVATAIAQTVAATAPPDMRSLAYGLFGIYALVFGGFTGAVVLGAISDATSARFALALIGPVCVVGGALLAIGSRHVRRDITLVIEDTLERYQEGRRRQAGGAVPALQVHHLDFNYGTQQVLFDISLEVAEGEVAALLGTNGAGKSTLLRAVSGLDHPTRGTIRIFGSNSTYLEAEQVLGLGVAMLPGGKVTFPNLTVAENLRVAGHSIRRDGPRLRAAVDEVYERFPVLVERRDQRAGTLSGGEQQMLALGRVLLTRPRMLLIDELTLGLAPKIVEGLIATVRQINADGATILLVEQSVNLALTLADHAFFLERGQVRFDGPTTELLARDDLLRPIFLTAEVTV
ncbi:MAG: transporter related [Acidimicrobiales bacterium]|nr:transporter related [Acidimicrobiales bacterium]